MSGFSVKGYFACPDCEEKTCAHWLTHGKRVCYLGHRRFLGENHNFRKEKHTFYGGQEFGKASRPLTGGELLAKIYVTKPKAYIINGCRFNTKSLDDVRFMQNSGVCIVAKTTQFSSVKSLLICHTMELFKKYGNLIIIFFL